MTNLTPMTESDFTTYMQSSIPEFAEEKILSGQWSKQEALEKSHDEFLKALPDGINTTNNVLYTLKNKQQKNIGILWYAIEKRAGKEVMYIYDINIKPEYRRRGHGTEVFRSLEIEAKNLGLAGIALHVFGFNTHAYNLYHNLGFEATNINMFKDISIEA